MNLPYILLLVSLIGYPIIAFHVATPLYALINRSSALAILGLFATHLIFFLLGFSLKGDYVDYIFFSLDYLSLCIAILLLAKAQNVYLKLVGIVGYIGISLCFLLALPGILFFIFVCQEYETDRIFSFTAQGKCFVTRRYSLGFATLDDTKYTFETYRQFANIPIEERIDVTDFFMLKSPLEFEDKAFTISVNENKDDKIIIFRSSNGATYKKKVP